MVVSLEVNKKEIAIIKGPSGSGKTTLLKIISSISHPDNGNIRILNKDVNKFNLNYLRGHKIGFVFQEHHLFDELSAKENIDVPKIITKKYNLDINSDILLNKINLLHKKHFFPSQLSTGEKQRIAIARAMINKPEIILADEPTGNLDKNNSLKVLNLICSFRREYDQTFLIVTHDDLFDDYADRIYELKNGEINLL